MGQRWRPKNKDKEIEREFYRHRKEAEREAEQILSSWEQDIKELRESLLKDEEDKEE